MINDVTTTCRTMPQWESYQKGIEALALSLASIESQRHNPNKSMTLGDLLVKPMQRVCRYPLLFAELLKLTPVCDCPDSHAEIENLLARLRETTTDINKATGDPRMKAILEKTWLLQDRLVLQDHPNSRGFVRTLGHIHLCGVFHFAWQTKNSVDGQYMVCLLYRDYLVLASVANPVEQCYKVQACIPLNELRVEEVDNGRGTVHFITPWNTELMSSRVAMPHGSIFVEAGVRD